MARRGTISKRKMTKNSSSYPQKREVFDKKAALKRHEFHGRKT